MNYPNKEPLQVLFIAPSEADYLAITLFHGLRSVLGDQVVDFPKYDMAYQSFPETKRAQIYGRGFTVFYHLEEIPLHREEVEDRVRHGAYDLIVFGCIWGQFRLFAKWRKWLSPKNTILCDGADTAQVYPHAGFWWRRPRYWLLPRATRGFLYFKREWTDESQFGYWHRLLPRKFWQHLPCYPGLRRISFSIPEEKIASKLPPKTKDFPKHIVDGEIAALVPGSATSYAFTSEAEYYSDLQSSRFGITTKRAGWDCLRHYEIAANGCVPCFRDLVKKPADCAPHDLAPGVNCLSYSDPSDLLGQVKSLAESDYARLQLGAMEWARSKSTRVVAMEVTAQWQQAREDMLVKRPAVGRAIKSAAKSNGTAGNLR